VTGNCKNASYKTGIVLLLGFLFFLWGFPAYPQESSGNGSAHLDDANRELLEKKALDGDVAAAVRLTDHYEYSVKDETRYTAEEVKQIVLWLEVAVNDGDPDSQVSLGGILTGDSIPYVVTPESCKHGRELLSDAKNKGFPGAAQTLSSVTPYCKFHLNNGIKDQPQ
jgi:hypothetical protein